MLSELSSFVPDVGRKDALLLLLCFTESLALAYCLNFLHRDPLTELLNRRGFFTMAPTVTSRSRYAVIAIDFDWFKRINDTLGHDCGDQVLVAVAQMVRLAVRRHLAPNAVVARFGGEEFMVLVPLDTEGATRVAKCIRRLVAIRDFGLGCQVTVSIGVAGTQPGEELTLDDLLRRADAAVYEAKHRGRNQVHTWNETEAPLSRRSRLRSSNRPAAQRRSRFVRLMGRTSRTLWRLSPHRLLGPPMGVFFGNLQNASPTRKPARRLFRAFKRLRSAVMRPFSSRNKNKRRSR